MQSNDRQDSAQRLSRSLVGLSAVALLAAGSLSFAAEAVKQDSEVAAEYKSEAAQLRDEAEHHRKLALTTRAGLLRRDRGVMRALRKTGYKIFARYQKCGLEGLTDRSRRPQRHANQLPFQIEARIVQLGLIEKPDLPEGVSEAIAGIDEVLDGRASHCRAPALEWFGGSRPPPTRATM